MQQMRSSMMDRGAFSFFLINTGGYGFSNLLWQLRDKMSDQLIFFTGIGYHDFLVTESKNARITYLAAALSIKGSTVKHQLNRILPFCIHFPVPRNARLGFRLIISHKFGTVNIFDCYPILCIYNSSRTAPVLLFFHLFFETRFIYL